MSRAALSCLDRPSLQANILASKGIEGMENKRPGLADMLRNGSDPEDSPEGRRAGRDAVLTFFKALGSRDRAALTAAITEDVIHEIPFSESGSTKPGRFRRFAGRDAVVDFWMTIVPGIKVGKPEDIELSVNSDGSRIFIEQRGDMTMPDGKRYRNRYVFRFSIRDGKVCHSKEYFNPIIAAYAFGRPIADGIIIDRLEEG
jgi:ketosteroid isomerase-like protein